MSSLQEYLAAQREEMARDRTEVVPVPGYEKRLAARYRLIDAGKAEEIMDRPGSTLERAADTLINSCIELLEIDGTDENGNPQYRSTGHRWTPAAVRELFGVELPENTTARAAVLAVFPPPLGGYKLIQHFKEMDERLAQENGQADEELLGESEPATAGSSS